jgi:hypothetical protein
VLTPLGVLLALLGGHARLSLLGGMGGAGIGSLLGLAAEPAGALATGSVGLIGGALMGATLCLTVSWGHVLARLLGVLVRDQKADPSA